MPKPLRLDRDGRLAVPEAEVRRNIRAYFEAHGWEWIDTRAEDLTRAGAAAHRKGTLDALAIKPEYDGLGGLCRVVLLELKRRRAKTEKKHLAEQTREAYRLLVRGFLVYQAPEDDPDPIGHFQAWARARDI